MSTLWLAAAVALAGPRMIPAPDGDLVGRAAPSFEAPLRDGGTFDLAREHGDGKALVLAFWASWCVPCHDALPALARLEERRDDLRVVTVNVDRDRARAEAFLRGRPVDLPVVWDNEAHGLGRFDVVRMPTTFLLDDGGTIALRTTHADDRLVAELEAALDVREPE